MIIHGFSSLPVEKRLKLLIEKIKDEFPEVKIIAPNYLEHYGKFGIQAGRLDIFHYALVCRNKIRDEIIDGPIIFIGYSMGALIARMLVEQFRIEAKAVILVGGPNQGIKLSFWEKLFTKNILCVKDMKKDSPLLRSLNLAYEDNKPTARYYLIAGEKDKRVPLNSALGIEGKKIIIPQCDHSGLIPKKPTSKPNAIGAIINILKEEVNLKTSSFLLEKIVKLNRSQPKLKISVFL